jgi:hypothetical protein
MSRTITTSAILAPEPTTVGSGPARAETNYPEGVTMNAEIELDESVPPLPPMRWHSTFTQWVNGCGPYAKPNYVYVASSWRNLYQPGIVAVLRAAGIDCYDFRDPANRGAVGGFSWKEIDPNWLNWTPAQWRDALRHPIAQNGFANDKGGMDRADCCVLVLPSGRSAHLEAAFMAADGKPVFTLALERVEPDLMNLLLGPPEHICVTMDDLFDRLGVPK